MVLGHCPQIQKSLWQRKEKGPFATSCIPSSCSGHRPALIPEHEDLLTPHNLWGAVPMSQNTESSMITHRKTLMEATAKGMI